MYHFWDLQTEANNHFRKANMKGFMQHPVTASLALFHNILSRRTKPLQALSSFSKMAAAKRVQHEDNNSGSGECAACSCQVRNLLMGTSIDPCRTLELNYGPRTTP